MTNTHPFRCILITPARNEEALIEGTIRSVLAQTVRPVKWVIVNGGSTDGTGRVVARHAAAHDWISVIDLPVRQQRSFAAKVQCFNAGYESVKGIEHDIIGNLDADVSFEPDYLEFLLSRFAGDPELGVAGTTFEEEGYSTAADSFEGEMHVPGGCQLFRRECFEQIGGYIPNQAGGIDWIAVTTARMRGWKTRAFRERSFFHHRSLGTADRGVLRSKFSYGEKDYYLGGHPLWELFRVGYRLTRRPYVFAGLALGAGYLWAALNRVQRAVTPELMRFHRAEQMKKLKAIWRSLLTFRTLDNFRVLPS